MEIISNSNNKPVEVFYEEDILNPDLFTLKQNFPNPFNPTTQIEFELGASENIELLIFDVNGRFVDLIIDNFLSSGTYSFVWNAYNYNSGIYFVKIYSDNEFYTKKITLIK